MEIDIIKALASVESDVRGTSLVTIYIPAGSNLWLAREHVAQELKTTSNIKNKNVRKATTDALKSINYKLKTMSTLQENGLVICAGSFMSTSMTTIENQRYF